MSVACRNLLASFWPPAGLINCGISRIASMPTPFRSLRSFL